MDIDYSDGREIEGKILSLIRSAPDRASRTPIAFEHYQAWPVRYHLCPERSNLLRPFDFSGMDVLELGAGMGAVSRYLAETANSLYVVEGTQLRFDVLTERLKGLENWDGEVGNFQDFKPPRLFDVVCLIGVLEYSELFLKGTGESPHLWLLKRCKEFLKPGGMVFVAIENKLGLKYWNGAAEDHRATLFDSVCGYPDTPTPRTFSRKELRELMQEAGLAKVDEFFPFPDYKVPTTVVSSDLIDKSSVLAAELAATVSYRDYLGLPSIKSFPDTLSAMELSKAGLLGDFSNSFLFAASTDATSPIRRRVLRRSLQENERAWHYGAGRLEPTQTVFFGDRRSESILVQKTLLYTKEREKTIQVKGVGTLRWNSLGPETVTAGESLRWILVRHAYFGQWELFQQAISDFLRDSLKKGPSIDGIFVNARRKDGAILLFDLEWTLDGEMPASWFVLRNVYNLVRDEECFNQGAPFKSFAELYRSLCDKLSVGPDFERDLAREAALQAATSQGDFEHHLANLKGLFERVFGPPLLPRDPNVESALRHGTGTKPWKRIPRALVRRTRSVLKRSDFLKRAAAKSRRGAAKLRSKSRFVAGFASRKLHFIPSETTGEYSALTPDFPKGYVLITNKGKEKRSFSFGLRVDESFSTQTFDLPAGRSLVRVAADVESVSVTSEATPAVSVRRIGKVELLSRILPKVPASLWLSPKQARAQLPVNVIEPYGAWVAKYGQLTDEEAARIRDVNAQIANLPKLSVLMPVYNTPEKYLRDAIQSVREQIYDNWELCIADDASTEPHVRTILEEQAASDSRIMVVFRKENGHISAASNSALELATGEFVALLDHDDLLAPQALASVANAIVAEPNLDLIYSDEDKIDSFGRRYAPHFKPEWNPELLYSKNYVSHLSTYRRELLEKVGGFEVGSEGSQDYDLVLRVVENTQPSRIKHIPEVLYHWRAIPGSVALGEGEKTYAHERARDALRRHFERQGKKVEVSEGFGFMHRVRHIVAEPPPVSILIPTRDRKDLLKKAVDGIRQRTDYPRFEILIIDNQSTDPQTLEYFRVLKADPRVRIFRYDAPFNYSAITNVAAKQAACPVLVLFNNDLVVKTRGWLMEMVSHALQPDVGCVGAKLVYPNGTIQHAGVTLGIGGVADHLYRHFPVESDVDFGALHLTRSVSAVSAACLAVRRAVFEAAGGFDEKELAIAYNDVDFCLRVRERGYRNIWTPYAELLHLESASRGSDLSEENRRRFEAETQAMKKRWAACLGRDPSFNSAFSLKRPDGALAFPPRREPFYRIKDRASTASPNRPISDTRADHSIV